MQFEISHDLDAPLDALQLALVSPELGAVLCGLMATIESITTRQHQLDEETFERCWRYQASAPLAVLRRLDVRRDMMMWDEHWDLNLVSHEAHWHIMPRPDADLAAPWRKRFTARGQYRLESLGQARCRRTIRGNLDVALPLLGRLVERAALAELRKAYDAEAQALITLIRRP